MSAGEVVGFDLPTVEAWLLTVTDVRGPFEWTRLPGGHSNLTYLVSDGGGRQLVIRRPPQGELLPKAHDMWREYRIIEALWPTAVPVAQPIAYCDNRAVAEVHFYVMGKVDGQALFDGATVSAWLDEPARRHAGEVFVDVLASLHSLDPAEIGLADLGRPTGYVARLLNTWYRSWNTSIPFAGFDDERIHTLHALFESSIPEQGPARVVHGDFGPHNSLFSSAGDLLAVLDWELASLGDPLADFAYSLNAWAEPGGVGVYGNDPPTALPGFPSRAELAQRYAEVTGADLSNLAYYRAVNSWKTACILHGVYARYLAGQKSTEGVDLDGLRHRVSLAVDAAATQAAELS
jgi:aminoglycoside phosphotransferase (APT) family kinase protein